MKHFLMAALLAAAMAAVADSSAWAFGEPGVGASCRRVGRFNGHWIQPTTGPLYDYSYYFAMMYPQLPGAQDILYGDPDKYRRYPIQAPPPGETGFGPGAPVQGPNPTWGRGRRANAGASGSYTVPPGATVTQPAATGSTPAPSATPSR